MQGWMLLGLLPLGLALAALFDGDDDGDSGDPGTDDALEGTLAADRIDAGAGNDTISNFGGDDTILGGDGDDEIHGSSGTQRDYVDAGAGDDTVRYVGDHSTVLGGAGDDQLTHLGETGDGLIVEGGTGNDTLGGNGQLNGGAGDDLLFHSYGTTVMTGGEGADVFAAAESLREGHAVVTDFNAAEDRIVLNGVTEADLDNGLVRMTTVTLPDGATELHLGDPSHPLMVLRNVSELTADAFPQGFAAEGTTMTGTAGDDPLQPGPISGGMHLGAWEHLLVDAVQGGDGDDYITGEYVTGYLGRLTLDGGGGDDHITGGFGSDVIDGGTGNDRIRDSDPGFLFDGADTPLAQDDDSITGGAGNDWISTGNGADSVWGGDGDDVLIDAAVRQDRSGDDSELVADDPATLDGGAGDDTLDVNDGDVVTLGEGADQLWIRRDDALPGMSGDMVTVTDFVSGEDRVGIGIAGEAGDAAPVLRTWAAADGSGLYVGVEGRDDALAFLSGVDGIADGDISVAIIPRDGSAPIVG